MGVSCQISLNLPEGVKIVTGSTLKGTVKFYLDKETVYKTISLALISKLYCDCCCRRKVDKKSGDEIIKGKGHKKYTIGKIHFLKEINDKIPISAGTYKHLFKFDIPEEIPPSFTNKDFLIRYFLILKFKKFGLFSINKEFIYTVTIFPRIPHSVPKAPVNIALDILLTKLFTNIPQYVNVKAKLDSGYLVPSYDSLITCLVTNNSDVMLTVKTELIHVTKYKDCQGVKRIEESVIDECSQISPIVIENSIANMHNIIRILPNMYTVRYSKMVKREFKLKITLKLPMPHSNASIEVPIFLGEREPAAIEDQKEASPTYWKAMPEQNKNLCGDLARAVQLKLIYYYCR